MNIELKIVRHDRMFPFVHGYKHLMDGCDFDCSYCWARRKEIPRATEPRFRGQALHYPMEPGKVIFVNPSSDTFCRKAEPEWILKTLTYIRKYPETAFLMMTKNPKGYLDYRDRLPRNLICGATIETNRDTSKFSKAPHPRERVEAMSELDWPNKFLSIEPVMNFDTLTFSTQIAMIKPRWVAIGYDNYGFKLPEPDLEKVEWLIEVMEKNGGMTVFRKTLRERWGV